MPERLPIEDLLTEILNRLDRADRLLEWLIGFQRKERNFWPCGRCGHSLTDHFPEGDQSCRFPASLGAPQVLCHCESYRRVDDGT